MGKIAPIEVSAKIDRREYVQIPGHGTLISMFEPENFKGYDWDETHIIAGEKRLQMAPPKLFAPHLLNVIKAHEGKNDLYNGLGNPLSEGQVEDLYKHLTSDSWSYLDAKFRLDHKSGLWYMQTDHKITGKRNNREHSFMEVSLGKCLMEDGFAALKFNSQGLATTRSKVQRYEQGKNIYFYSPQDGSVTGFYANSGRVGLGCYRGSADAYLSLGAYVIAQKI